MADLPAYRRDICSLASRSLSTRACEAVVFRRWSVDDRRAFTGNDRMISLNLELNELR